MGGDEEKLTSENVDLDTTTESQAMGGCCPSPVHMLTKSNDPLDGSSQQNVNESYVDFPDRDDASTAVFSDAPSEASMNVLMRYLGLSSGGYMKKSKKLEDMPDIPFKHDLREGDHVIRWKMLGYCYPIQVHGIVFSAGPDVVTIVDCGLSSTGDADKAGLFEDESTKGANQTRRKRMDILTLVDEKEIKKWTKIRYGEEVELQVHSSNEEMQKQINEKDLLGESSQLETEAANETATADKSAKVDEGEEETEQSPSAGLKREEIESCAQATIKSSPEKSSKQSPRKSWFSRSSQSSNGEQTNDSKQSSQKLRLPKADPPALVLARLRFLLEYGEEPFPSRSTSDSGNNDKEKQTQSPPNLLPPHHLLYANSECIAVYCKTGRWCTIQAMIFLHSSAVGNAKQSVTLAAVLSAQTVTVPASGFWGFFGGTTTVSLFSAQPWLVPALAGGGMVYVGLPMIMLLKAKRRWRETEERLNDAFGGMYDSDGRSAADGSD